MEYAGRVRAAQLIREARAEIAARVTREFSRRHPEWAARYGSLPGIDETCLHIDSLSAALEADFPEAFTEHARWAGRMMGARGVPTDLVAENIALVGNVAAALASDEANCILACVANAAAACGDSGDHAGTADTGDGELRGVRRLFVEAIRDGNRSASEKLLIQALEDGREIAAIYTDIIQEALYEIGRLWESNQITVADEHMATAVAQYATARLYAAIEHEPPTRGRVVITGVEGEYHQMGANIMADFLDAHGWNVRFLGVNTPHDAVLRAVEEHEADIVGVSATMFFSVPKMMDLVTKLRSRLGAPVGIIFGGAAVRLNPGIAQDAGADAWAGDLRSGLAAVAKLS